MTQIRTAAEAPDARKECYGFLEDLVERKCRSLRPVDTMAGEAHMYHERADSDPPLLQDLNSDEEVPSFSNQSDNGRRDKIGRFTTQIGSGRHDELCNFPTPMGSGRRDARVVCETFSSGKIFSSASSPKMRPSVSQKGPKAHARRRSLAYSRNPLLACFIGESVLAARGIPLSTNCDSAAASQRTFFSLIPVDRNQVEDKTGEPQSPQLSCIGQVKLRQVKTAKSVAAMAEELARTDINDDVITPSLKISKTPSTTKFERESFKVHKGQLFYSLKQDSFRSQVEESSKLRNMGSFKLCKEESFKAQKEESFKRQKEELCRLQKELSWKLQKNQIHLDQPVYDIPHLDLAGRNPLFEDLSITDTSCVKDSARLVRCRRVMEDEKRVEDEEKVHSPVHRNTIRYLNQFS
jgi:hypothetical protein